MKTTTVQEFFKQFPDDNVCLDFLMKKRHGDTLDCPKCGKHGKFYRIKRHPAYECAWCGHAIHPMAGTIFTDSHTPLQKWFYALYLFTTTRHGVPAKEIQRQLGVSYPTALRITHKIREHMAEVDGEGPLDGLIEADETYIGGRVRGRGHGYRKNKTVVFGMAKRGGDIMTKVVSNVKRRTLEPLIRENVAAGSTVHTDDLRSYLRLPAAGYKHGVVNHSAGEYVRGNCHVNSVEGFLSRLKNSIHGTHIHVSRKHLWKYLKEFEFRYNLRKDPGLMFPLLIHSL